MGSGGILSSFSLSNALFRLRLYRTFTGLAVGATLGISGLLLQAMLRNPLADPFILGISSGSAFGSLLGVYFSIMTGHRLLETFSFLGALLSFAITYLLSMKTGFRILSITLSGIMVSTLFSNLVLIVLLVSPFKIPGGVSWFFGQLALSSKETLVATLAGLMPLLVYAVLKLPALRAIMIGDEYAESLGYNTRALRREILIVTSWSIALSTAGVGPIGFVGIIVPHISRMLTGGDPGAVYVNTLLLAPSILLLGDVIARIAFIPQELPVGVIMSVMGAPFFIYLLLRTSRGLGA